VLVELAVLAVMVWSRWELAGLAVACGIALVGGLIVWAVVMPGWLAPPLRGRDLARLPDAKARLEAIDARTRLHHDLRNGVLQLLTVLAVLAGALVGFQQLTEDRDQARQQLSEDRDKALKDRQLTRQGQASERFTRAIDQLGSSRVETRIGGIYGLGQIAEQSPDNTGPVGEVLLAWLNSRPRTQPEALLRDHAPDVQAALSVLTGQGYASIVRNRLDLHGQGLMGVDLGGAQLGAARLDVADLTQANLSGAQLVGANLVESNLYIALLGDADLRDADLTGAKLVDATLREADLSGADLYGANLGLAHLADADLGGAKLVNAALTGADLHGAYLLRADLRGAILRGANLKGANLGGTALGGADLRGAEADKSTRWPAGFDWRRAGVEIEP
jgi:uncharacterized protein YjbI with pentapeptide repeats